ncbi:phosphoenolpyruvate carboxykinase (GTP) [Desulfobacter hydrogenophilus]|uniref:phosphoenolpyruvate carboxykinase (GTP) n=1 Tax=Desulfobacter hydrogenophilus TaxID=2291 RepID=A0A328FD15_9BACT|nr:phosphoenolpyruvate carboxykinase (GTP) [Desulfobacter hydrogenophilus]NDY73781.1 phosphoenolpyruvate carboxykinase (GTP) [Desulfobacter hydrogenophilus]QBH14635.1 phosphoenolpyruvate carboxykinase (GTP) [Desulfobacter hydrogenophilus]RAM01003.1 phosphoenolpyruvate carboxykinase (GTP) [Desulfobacter hydrogenophilus]
MDPLNTLGNISSPDQAEKLFKVKLDSTQSAKMAKIKHPEVLIRIANAIALCRPSKIFINTGSEQDKETIRKIALEKGEELALAMSGHTIHFDLAGEQGRIVDRTYYIAEPQDLVSSLANRMPPEKAAKEIEKHMSGIMENLTMIVGFYMRGPVGSPVANPALELTSSAYISHSAELLYRNAFDNFDREVEQKGYFFTNVHSEGLNRTEDLPHARVFMDRKYQTTYAWKCTYAGNTLLLKKGNHRFAVDKAVYQDRGRELSEHMFITGIGGPGGRTTWCAGAAPSGCGKTTTAMAGNVFIGDDLAQMWIAQDGSIRTINPENGIFGIVEGVNDEGDPLLMKVLRQPGCEVIWSNVLMDEKLKPHWVGNMEPAPEKGINFQGEWHQGKTNEKKELIPISHPNSRCTLASDNLDNFSPEATNPDGVVTRIFTYSGRDADTMPPVWVAKNPDAGVVIGACIVSATTATEVGVTGIKRAPWANAPFIPGALGDYMDAQFKFFNNPDIKKHFKPVMAGLNYFLTHQARGGDSSKLLGEKRDVKVWLAWLERYAHNEVGYLSTPIGNLPCHKDLAELFEQIIDKDYPRSLYDMQFALYTVKIIQRIELQEKAYAKEENFPEKLFEILAVQKTALLNLKEKIGDVIMPDYFENLI